MGVSLLLELDGPSCEAFEEVSSIDVLPHGSGKGCCLFDHGDCLGSGLGEAVADGCSSAWSVLVQVEQIEVMKVIVLTKCGKR